MSYAVGAPDRIGMAHLLETVSLSSLKGHAAGIMTVTATGIQVIISLTGNVCAHAEGMKGYHTDSHIDECGCKC